MSDIHDVNGSVGESPTDPSLADSSPVLEAEALTKSFGPIHALRGVDVAFRAGEIHGLVGANGAGKSTLIRILAGIEHPDSGELRLRGEPIHVRGPHHAAELGFGFIHQELSLVESFTSAQNIALGNRRVSLLRPTRFTGVSPAVRAVAERVGITFRLDVPVSHLTVHQKWLVSIARSLFRNHALIAMDEPTAALGRHESDNLMDVARALASDGVAIIYVSHRMDEISGLCDRVTVFKDGGVVAAFDRRAGAFDRSKIIHAIVGHGVADVVPGSANNSRSARPLLTLHDVRRAPAVRGVDLDLWSGELVGIAGLVGSGRSELAGLMFGADRPDDGAMELDQADYRPRCIADAVSRGVAYVPEERRSQGLFMSRTTEFNMNIATWGRLRVLPRVPITSRGRSRRQVESICAALRVKSARPGTPVWQLSGGNQQKVVMGKWLALEPKVLILDEPTRGVDVGAREEIYGRIRELAERGAGVIVISSEFEELLACDRVIVMREGRVVGELEASAISVQAMLRLCYG